MQGAIRLHVQQVVVVCVERAADFKPALQEFVGVRLRQRSESADARDAAAAHGAGCPDEAAVDVEIARAADVCAGHGKQAGAADRGIAAQRDQASAECEGACSGQVNICREGVSGIAVGEQVQIARGTDIDPGTLVGAECGTAAAAGLQEDVAVVRHRAQRAGRSDVQYAAVLHVQPLVVVGVERAGHLQPALDEPVAGGLRQLGLTGDARHPIAIHAAVEPAEVVAQGEVAAAEQVGTRHGEVAAAGDHRIAGQREAPPGQCKGARAAGGETGRYLIADTVVGIQADLSPRGDIHLGAGLGAEQRRTTCATVEVDVAVMCCGLQYAT